LGRISKTAALRFTLLPPVKALPGPDSNGPVRKQTVNSSDGGALEKRLHGAVPSRAPSQAATSPAVEANDAWTPKVWPLCPALNWLAKVLQMSSAAVAAGPLEVIGAGCRVA